MELDGKRQRNALTAAERAIEALGAGERTAALSAAERAGELDQIGVFGALAGAIGSTGEPVDQAGWDRVRASVPSGPLHALIDRVSGAADG